MVDELPTTARGVFDLLDDFLLAHAEDGESAKVWAVLTALRGPDNKEDDLVKHATTCHVRMRAFPKLAAGGEDGYASFVATLPFGTPGRVTAGAYMSTTHVPSLSQAFTASEHFGQHVQNAFTALDITTTPTKDPNAPS
jgi:hypothetical protein